MYLSMYKCVPVIVDVCFFRVRGNFALLAKTKNKKNPTGRKQPFSRKEKKAFPLEQTVAEKLKEIFLVIFYQRFQIEQTVMQNLEQMFPVIFYQSFMSQVFFCQGISFIPLERFNKV